MDVEFSANALSVPTEMVMQSEVKVAQSCPTLCDPMNFSRPEYWSGQPFPSPGDLPNPGIKPRSPALQEDSLLAEPQGKPKNTGVGSLSRLQWIFLTQESNRGLLHCRRILYQLVCQGSLKFIRRKHRIPTLSCVVSGLLGISCSSMAQQFLDWL